MKILKMKSCSKLSLPSVIILNPLNSALYRRLILVVYVLVICLVVGSSFYGLLKIILVLLLLIQLKYEYQKGSCCAEIKSLSLYHSQKIIIDSNHGMEQYNSGQILIHNPFFQLVQLTAHQQKKIIILFNDQLDKKQLRLLHLYLLNNDL